MTNGNDAAFATATSGVRSPTSAAYDGLTKREYFAAMAMQAIIAADDATTIMSMAEQFSATPELTVAMVATDHADALIEALNK